MNVLSPGEQHVTDPSPRPAVLRRNRGCTTYAQEPSTRLGLLDGALLPFAHSDGPTSVARRDPGGGQLLLDRAGDSTPSDDIDPGEVPDLPEVGTGRVGRS